MYLFKHALNFIAGIIVFLSILPIPAFTKVLIFTYSFNRPEFIEIQDKTFKKFLLDDYEFIVFNDAKDPSLHGQIHQTCNNLNIRCVDMPQKLHTSEVISCRNAAVVNYSLNLLGFNEERIVALLDSDMFLVKPFSIEEYMKDSYASALRQVRTRKHIVVDYLWVGLVFLDMKRLPNKTTLNFQPGMIRGVETDTGGCTYHYLSQNRNVPIRDINLSYAQDAYNSIKKCPCLECQGLLYPCKETVQNIKKDKGLDENQIKYVIANGSDPTSSEFYLDSHFFHYRCGSNWNNQSTTYHLNKTRAFNSYIKAILEE